MELLSSSARAKCLELNDHIVRLCPKTGEVKWTSAAWESIRSDSHQLTLRACSDLWIQGSPARVIGNGCSVFGAGASHALDLPGSLQMMIGFVETLLGEKLPPAKTWAVTRIDVTANLLLGSLTEVKDALRILRDCEGGRYRVSQQAGDTVYWSHRSKLRSGKAYAKGPHLRYQKKSKNYTGPEFSDDTLAIADRLLRLELKLGREFFQRVEWQTLSRDNMVAQWQSYFNRMIGSADMKTDNDVKESIFNVASTEGRAKSAYGCWLLIQSEGWERARESFAKTTWYRHIEILRAAGLSDADISSGAIVPLRQNIMTAQIVDTWAELIEMAQAA